MWKLEPLVDNNGREAGVAGMNLGWLREYVTETQPKLFPGTHNDVRVLVDLTYGRRMCDYLNGDYGKLADLDDRWSYMDMERVPQSVGYP